MKKNAILAALALLSFTACEVEILETATPQAPKMILSASAEQRADTRTSLNSEKAVVWDADDALKVFSAENPGLNGTFSLVDGEGTASASFQGEAIDAESFLAVYPASSVNGTPTCSEGVWSIPVSIPATQTFVEGNIPDEANLAVALGGESLAFKNVFGVLKLQLWAKSSCTVKKIQIAAAEPLAGEGTVTYDGSAEPTFAFTGNTSKVLTIEISAGLKLSTDKENPTEVYAVVPAGSFAGGFTVGGATASIVISPVRTTKDNTIHRNLVRTMPANTTGISLVKYLSDLANTYIVNPSSAITVYPYKPDGNLAGHVKTSGFSRTKTISAVSGSSCAGSLSTAAYFKYTASANEGVEVISASDEDGIFWSWTVWTTDTPADLTLTDGTVIMDRNLGASAASISDIVSSYAETRGLNYQWGRKDPVTTGSARVESSETVGTVEYSIAHPGEFIYANADGLNAYDWCWEAHNDLWSTTKTIYDPCPAGYQVPNGGNTGIFAANDFKSNAGTYDSTNLGFNVSALEDGGTFWLPNSAYIKDTGTALTAYTGGKYLCCNSVAMTGGGYYGRIMSVAKSGITNSTNQARAIAGSIRCQKISE